MAVDEDDPTSPLPPSIVPTQTKATLPGGAFHLTSAVYGVPPKSTGVSITNRSPPYGGQPASLSIILASSTPHTSTITTSPPPPPASQTSSPSPSAHSGLSTGKLVAIILPPVMVVLILAPVLTIAFLEWRRKRRWRNTPKLSVSQDTRLLGPRQTSAIFASPSPSPFIDEEMRESPLRLPREISSPAPSRTPSPKPPSLFTPNGLPGRQSLYSSSDPPPAYASQAPMLQPPETFGRVRTRSHSSLSEANLSAHNGAGVRFPFADGESDIVSELSFERGSGITIRRARDPDEISFVSALEPDEQIEADPHPMV